MLTASGGPEGIGIYQSHPGPIDLVIPDMIMPDMTGTQVFDRLREIDPEVGVLLSTGYSIDSRATEVMIRECRGHLQKPMRSRSSPRS